MKVGVITRKAQVTIPAEVRRRLGLQEGMKVRIRERAGKIVIEPLPSIFTLGGSGAGRVTPAEAKRMLDRMREEDL